MKPRALLVGYYGAANAGDELLLAQLIKWLAELDWEAVVLSRNPEHTRLVHGVESVDFANLGSIALAMGRSQAVVFGGGGLFQDHHQFTREAIFNPAQNDIAAYGRIFHLAQQYAVPLALLGQGVGPLRSSETRDLVLDLFRQAELVTLRDADSAALLEDIGLRHEYAQHPDIAWVHAIDWASPRLTAPLSNKRVVVVPRRWPGEEFWLARLARALQLSVPSDWTIQVVGLHVSVGPGDASSDESTLRRLAGALGPELHVEMSLCPNVEDALQAIARADVLVSMRLHASIMGLALKKPLLGIEYDNKMASVHQSVGLPNECRLRPQDEEERYLDAMRHLFSAESGWTLRDDTLLSLRQDASGHKAELARMLMAARQTPSRTSPSPRLDWLALWAQSLYIELKLAQEASRRAHDLLAFQQHLLDQRLSRIDAKLERLIGDDQQEGDDEGQ